MLRVDEALRALAEQDPAVPSADIIRRIEERLYAESPTEPRAARSRPQARGVRTWWRHPAVVLAATVVATLLLIGGVTMLAFQARDEVVDEPPVPPTVPSTVAPSPTLPATTAPPTTVAPATTLPPPEPTPDGSPVAAGYDCAYIVEAGYEYGAALAYWVREGRPKRMDPDGNGIPCDSQYPAPEIAAIIDGVAQPAEDADVGSGDGGVLGSDMLCADVADLGYGFASALAYWVREGAPARMDADHNGLPCETVYPWVEIEAVMGFDGTAFRSPPATPLGWSPTTLDSSVVFACCGQNSTGPASPPLPPAAGGFPHDGEYHTDVERSGGNLTVRLRRWIPCSEAPDQCVEPEAGDITVDLSEEVTVVLPLDSALAVVLHPIFMPDGTAVAGDGSAFAEFIAGLDEEYATWLGPEARLSCAEPDKLPIDATGCPFVSLWGAGWPLAYRGPLGSYLVMLPKPPDEVTGEASDWEPGEVYGWDVALVISDGTPILHIGAGRIAG